VDKGFVEELARLEQLSRGLEPDSNQRALLLNHVMEYAEQFIQSIGERPAYIEPVGKGRTFYESPISEEGISIESALEVLREHVDLPGLNPTSGRFLGYIPGGALFHSALGDFLAAVSNRYAGVFFASPGAVRMENMLWNWMADIAGYPEGRGGSLTSGGSIANLAGIVTARDAYQVGDGDLTRSVIYMTNQVNHSVGKALRIAGLSRTAHRFVPTDSNYRMDARALADAVHQDKLDGLRPWLVIGSAGTTNSGSVDPIDDIADIAASNQMWFHLDGAYGAFFILTPEVQGLLSGMGRSDSLVMDPHKTLFLPYGTGAILVKDRAKLYASHQEGADYMQDTVTAVEEMSPADLSPELTRHFRGLRLWLPLKLLGLAPFRAALSEKILLTRYFYEKIQEIDGFEVGPYPDLSVATYRYLPKRGDVTEFNRRLIDSMQKDGRVFISSTMLDNKFTLRLAVGVYRTHKDDIDLTLEILAEKARQMERGN